MEDKQKEILDLAVEMMKFPSISIGKDKNIDGIWDLYNFITDYLKNAGLRIVGYTDGGETPSVYCDCSASDRLNGRVLLTGHFDKVSPASPEQLDPKITGEWLTGRGSADMLTVAATYMVFMKDLKQRSGSGFGLLLVGNEEPGEADKWGTPYVLENLREKYDYTPELMIVGERTGDGEVLHGKIENKSRGIIRIHLEAKNQAGHTAVIKGMTAVEKILELKKLIEHYIPKKDPAWRSQFVLSYLLSGEPENFNTSPENAVAGFEIRGIPEDNISNAIASLLSKADDLEVKYIIFNNEPGISSSPAHPLIIKLLGSASSVFGGDPPDHLGSGKVHGSQARFAPEGCAQVVFGQSGVGPHTANEKHYIPSIIPYYKVLTEMAGED